MKLYLHSPNAKSEIKEIYVKAFANAKKLYVVTAYLTEWDTDLKLNEGCITFKLIIGKDFGITRKSACIDVMNWLPPERKSQFIVADGIAGFHPKGIFWHDIDDKFYALIGSSNLTKAAFETNYEANIFIEISEADFIASEKWVNEIDAKSVVVSNDWLDEYKEGQSSPAKVNNPKTNKNNSVKPLDLPTPNNTKKLINARRAQLAAHNLLKSRLNNLFLQCSEGEISSEQFYETLPEYWSWPSGNRLQGDGWERRGKASDFTELSKSFIRILNASDADRDDVVVKEIDNLKEQKNPSRKAFFSEILCLTYPDKYPVLNKPVHAYLSDIKFKAPKGSSEGAAYLDLAKKLRASIIQNPDHPAKNLAELDTIIWATYGHA